MSIYLETWQSVLDVECKQGIVCKCNFMYGKLTFTRSNSKIPVALIKHILFSARKYSIALRQLWNYIHHCHHYYSARKLILILPSHRG